jgi:protoporphyrinogen oxidase
MMNAEVVMHLPPNSSFLHPSKFLVRHSIFKLERQTHLSRRTGIIGGGFLGQTLALRLAQQGQCVTLYEAADHLGGLADAWQVGPLAWDRHYHVTLLSDTHLRRVLAELDLEHELEWGQTRTGFYSGGKLHSLSSTLEFLRFRPLKLAEKLRLAWTIYHASKIQNWAPLDAVPVEEWLRRHSGKGVLDKVWLPLLKSKLGSAYDRTSAAFIWATINRMYAARRSGLKREMFGYVRGGYARVLGRMAEYLRRTGVEIRVATPVREVTAARRTLLVTTHLADQEEFDHVVLTLPPPLAARLCPQLSQAETQKWSAVRMLGTVCVSAVLRRPLAGYYVTNITDGGFPFTGVIEMTALVDRRHFDGQTLVYLPKYVPSDDGLFDVSDDAIFDGFFAGLVRMYPQLAASDVVAWRVSRARHVMAIPEVGYAQRVPPIETSIPGLSLVSSAQILNNTLNVNATIGWAEACVGRLSSAALPGDDALAAAKGRHVQAPRELVARPR